MRLRDPGSFFFPQSRRPCLEFIQDRVRADLGPGKRRTKLRRQGGDLGGGVDDTDEVTHEGIRDLRGLLSRPFDIPAPANFGLRDSAYKPETGAPPAATATVVSHGLGDVLGQQQMPRKARRQHATHLNDSPLALANRAKRQRIADNNVGKCRNMLVAFGAIRVDHADVFHHAVEIDHPVWAAAENARQALVERRLVDSFLLEAASSRRCAECVRRAFSS